jgi:hypothetical protein
MLFHILSGSHYLEQRHVLISICNKISKDDDDYDKRIKNVRDSDRQIEGIREQSFQ